MNMFTIVIVVLFMLYPCLFALFMWGMWVCQKVSDKVDILERRFDHLDLDLNREVTKRIDRGER